MTTTDRPTVTQDPSPAERRRVGISEAVKKNWRIVMIPVVLFVVFAILISWARTPTYTAEATLNVGGTALPADQSVSNYVLAQQNLAAQYSRLVTANEVLAAAVSSTGLPPGRVFDHVSASPIPESSVFRVDATATSAGDAITIANAASASLIKYIAQSGQDTSATSRLLAQVRQAAEDVQNATSVGEKEAAQLRLETFRQLYQDRQAGLANSGIVQVLNVAGTASSDRSSVLQRLVFVGLLGGLAVGATLATFLANSDRRLRVPTPAPRTTTSSRPQRTPRPKRASGTTNSVAARRPEPAGTPEPSAGADDGAGDLPEPPEPSEPQEEIASSASEPAAASTTTERADASERPASSGASERTASGAPARRRTRTRSKS